MFKPAFLEKKGLILQFLLVLVLGLYLFIPVRSWGDSMPSLHHTQIALRTHDVHVGDVIYYHSPSVGIGILHRVTQEKDGKLQACGEYGDDGKPFCEWLERKDVIGKMILDF